MWRICPSSKSMAPSEHKVAYWSNFFIGSELWSLISSRMEFSAAKAFTKVIWFWVRVPVLSEQITDALPSVSTAGNFLIMAFFRTMRCTPMASTMVTMAGNPSGIAETANATAIINISITFMPYSNPIAKITPHIPRARNPIYLPNIANLCCRGVWVSPSVSNRSAILPISVFIPVAVTTAVAVP